ncbi:MAG: hypothetical protein QOI22_1874, partial [Verrucomicrobiota bacterium]
MSARFSSCHPESRCGGMRDLALASVPPQTVSRADIERNRLLFLPVSAR